MLTLQSLTLELQNAVGTVFPEQPVKVELRPTLRPEFGDLASECCMQLANRLHRPVVEVFERLKPYLPQANGLRIALDNDFLNVNVPLDFNGHQPALLNSKTFRVIVAPPTESIHGWSQLRLLSAGVLQCFWAAKLGSMAELYVGTRLILTMGSGDTSWSTCAAALRAYMSNPEQRVLNAELKVLLRSALEASVTNIIWCDGPLWEKGDFTQAMRDMGIELCYPPHQWLAPHDCYENTESLLAASDPQLFNCCMYLSGPWLAAELNLASAQRCCADNLPLWLNLQLERLARISMSQASTPQQSSDRLLWMRLKFIELFFLRAVEHGEVAQALAALHELLQGSTRWLNQARLGQAVAWPDWSPLSRLQALVGAGRW